MPYIKDSEIREALTKGELTPNNCGELNFYITKLCHIYIKNKGLRYSTLNEVIGVLECAKLELYRQVAAPYEDIKKNENGAVSELDES